MLNYNAAYSHYFSADQRRKLVVEYWDSPFAALENDTASSGIIMDIRQPKSGSQWTAYKNAIAGVGTSTQALTTFNDAAGTYSTTVASGGRVPVIMDYWAAGAPGWHGVSTNGAVAYHYRAHLRAGTARPYWSSSATPPFFLAIAGQGHVRIEKTVNGVTAVVFNDVVSEGEFLKRGFRFTPDITDMTTGAAYFLDIYYIQDTTDPWGGLVVKLCEGTQSATDSVNQATARLADVFSCSAFDDNTAPTKATLAHIKSLEVVKQIGQAPTATFDVPLLNPNKHDGFGWEWYRPLPTSNGQLRMWDGGTSGTVVKRKRLIRIKGGYVRYTGKFTTGSLTAPVDATQVWATNELRGMVVEIVDGTGAGQTRTIASNTATTVTLASAFTVAPVANSSIYEIREEQPIFTGFVHDYGDPDNDTVKVECQGFESRMLEQHDKNYPDKISYMSRGYYKLTNTTDPVYDVTAYDAWPLELALKDLMARAGITSGRMRAPLAIPTLIGTTSAVAHNYGVNSVAGNVAETLGKFRARTISGKFLKLSRQIHYGNNGIAYTETQPIDAPYIFAPENTKELWNRCRDITDRYGYDFWFDESGDAVLQPRRNPFAAVPYVPGDASGLGAGVTVTTKNNPSSFGGTYLEIVGAPATISKTVNAARIDVCFPRGTGLGAWRVKVYKGGQIQNGANGVVIDPSSTTESFYYDQHMTVDGMNSTLTTVWSGEFGTYQVDITAEPVTANTTTVRRLDSLFLYHTDPDKPLLANVLSTQTNAFDIQSKSNMDDMRNLVTIVGERFATTTDSNKFTVTNPNNPEAEFVVERQVYAPSIIDPADDSYIGYKKESVIYDSKITSKDMASYLANLFIYRQRNPQPSATVNHTFLPIIQLRDPVYAQEEKHLSVTSGVVRYVNGIRHRFDVSGKSITTLEVTPFPEYQAYEPREDVDIDANYRGLPVINMQVSYTGVMGDTKTNLPITAPKHYSAEDVIEVTRPVATGGLWGDWLNMSADQWPPVPGTLMISATGVPVGGSSVRKVPEDFDAWWAASPNNVYGYKDLKAPGYDLPTGSEVTISLPDVENVSGISGFAVRSDYMYQNVLNPTTGQYEPVVQGWKITMAGAVSFPATQGDDNVASFYWSWDKNTRTLKIRHARGSSSSSGALSYFFNLTVSSLTSAANQGWKANSPYHHIYNIDYRTTNKSVHLPWKEADSQAGHVRPTSATNYLVRYRSFYPKVGASFVDPYAGSSPFYDPYTSELGYLVDVRYDALVTGFYRVSIRAHKDNTVVAWLTEPTADVNNDEAHWTFTTAGANKRFSWDGVDQRGEWNATQSEIYAAEAQGAFEREDRPQIGGGFYVWNREVESSGARGPIAFIADHKDALGKPTFGQGTYGAWYVLVEVRNDTLAEVAANTVATPTDVLIQRKTEYPRRVSSESLDTTNALNSTGSAYIFTHLPEPTRCSLEVADWKAASAAYDDAINIDANWISVTDAGYAADNADAVINNQRPTRMRFVVEPRPGVLWSGKQNHVSIKTYRVAHPRVSIFDQVVLWEGKYYADTTTDDRKILSRRLMNDSHTIVFEDEGFRRAATFKNSANPTGTVEWVFQPKHFKKEFRISGVTESIRFMDYLQLEEVPYWNAAKPVGGQRARFQIAFMSYLWYLSAYTQDRSGRYAWAVNRSFVDKSKITTNDPTHWPNPTTWQAATAATYKMELPVDPMTQHVRSVVTRQWTDEGTWKAEEKTRRGFATNSVGDLLLKHKWHDHDYASATLNGVAWSTLALPDDNYSKYHKEVNGKLGTKLPGTWPINRQLGSYNGAGNNVSALGNWSWAKDPSWIPCVTRDFHPYYLMPPMPEPEGWTNGWRKDYTYGIVDSNEPSSDGKTGNDPAAVETWSSPVWDMSQAYSSATGDVKVRFWQNNSVKKAKWPTDTVDPNTLDYLRQDDTVHVEDLRGTYSKRSKPGAGPVKVTPGGAYWVNQYEYGQIKNGRNQNYPAPRVQVLNFFTMKFRNEYLWESASLFPVNDLGSEKLDAVNLNVTRYDDLKDRSLKDSVRYDGGAWTGWKDDTLGTSLWWAPETGTANNIFDTGVQPFATGPKIAGVTKDMYFHLVLVDSRT